MTSIIADRPGPIAWMAKNSVAANLLMLFFLVGGAITFFAITQEVFPDIQRNSVRISVSYPGASPEEVERGIVLPVEEAITGIEGIKEATSTAGEGGASIRVELIDGADAMQVYQDIQSEVDRIRTFPDEAEEPQVALDAHRHGVMSVCLFGDADDAVLKDIAERARDQFLQGSTITQVDIEGTRDTEIAIEISQESLRRYGLTMRQIADRLRKAAVELPAGGIRTEGGEVLVRVTERRDYGREFGRIPIIATRDGTQILLEDIATITDGLEEVDQYSTFNGLPAVMLEIYRVGEQTPTQVASAVREKLEQIRATLPDGIDAAIRSDRTEIYQQRASLLGKNGLIGLTLVFLLLSLFLEMRLAFWVMMGIPISFLGSLLLMPAADLSINMITMFAYIVALGIVVDDAIVVGENIYRHQQEGMPPIQAAVVGAREVAMPVGFSILTNVVAFLPLYLLPGFMGRILGMLPIVVVSVFLISWVESLFVLPAHLGHARARRRRGVNAWLHETQRRFSDGFRRWVQTRYAPFLSWCLDHRYFVVAVSICILTLTIGYMASGRMGFETFPKVESDYAYASAALPYGAPIEHTGDVAQRLVREARKVADEVGHPELIEGIFAHVGRGGTHGLDTRVYLAGPEIRKKIMGTQEFTERWRQRVGRVKGVEMMRFESDRGGPGGGSALTVELSHSDVKTLEEAASALAASLDAFPIVSDVDDGFQRGKEQLSFRVKPGGRAVGLTASDIAQQVRSAYEGVTVLRQLRGRNEVTVRIRLPRAERVSEGGLDRMILRNPAGGEVYLHDVVDVERGRAYTSIAHRNGRRTMTVTGDVRPRSETGRVIQVLNTEILPELMRRYPGLTYGYEGRQAEQRESIGSMWMTIPLVLVAIYALLAIPFRSYIQPAIVMMSIPFGIVGAAIGHLIMGYSLSLMGVIGIIALSGVVVNDSLVFVDFANRRLRERGDVKRALIDAGTMRFRPILLTTLTTFGGLAPMIFETSRQARFLIPMALSLGYGLLFATMITLVLVPSLYAIVEDGRDALRRRWHRDGSAEPSHPGDEKSC